MSKSEIVVFTDGACSGNPGPGGWGAIIATAERVWELGGGSRQTTNNQMELLAPAQALNSLRGESGEVTIFTDSKYVVQGITAWVFGWKKKGWKTASGSAVQNQEFWEGLLAEVEFRKKEGLGKIHWQHIRGHVGIDANERADRIAVAFAQKDSISLFDGDRCDYSVNLQVDLSQASSSPKSSKSRKGKAHSYLSYYGNEVRRHKTWAECENWVRGRSGAKYKKALSPQEETQILEDWGLSAKTPIK